jgi:predicted Zn finger-like uncharacterized protein
VPRRGSPALKPPNASDDNRRWMIIQCTACQTRFKVAGEKVRDGVRARCKKCGAVFAVRRDSLEVAASNGSGPSAPACAAFLESAAPCPSPLGVDPFAADPAILGPRTGSRAHPVQAAPQDPFGDLIAAVRPPPGPRPSALAAPPEPPADLALAAPSGQPPGSGPSSFAASAPAPGDGHDPFGLPASSPLPFPGPPALAPKTDPFASLGSLGAGPNLLSDLNSFDLAPDEGGATGAVEPAGEGAFAGPAAQPPAPALPGPLSAPSDEVGNSARHCGSGPGALSPRAALPPAVRAPARPAALPRASGPKVRSRTRRRRTAVGSLVNAAAVSAAAAAAIVFALRNPPPGGQRISRPADILQLLAGRPAGDLVADELHSGPYATATGRSLLVVRGRVINRGSSPRGPVAVAAEVLHRGGAALRQTALAGALPTPEDLWRVENAAALAELNARSAEAAERLPPGGSAPFAVVFFDCPEDLAERELKLTLTEVPPPPGLRDSKPGVGSSPASIGSAPEWPVVPAPDQPLRVRSGQAAAQGLP